MRSVIYSILSTRYLFLGNSLPFFTSLPTVFASPVRGFQLGFPVRSRQYSPTMAGSTLYRFRIDLSDIDHGVYTNIDVRTAMHPSETEPYLLTRALAFALNFHEDLRFSPGGLSDPDQPCILRTDANQETLLWIEVANPSAKKIHRASKSARQVKIYTYKDPELLVKELTAHSVYHADRIEIFGMNPRFLDRLAEDLTRDVHWNVMLSDGALTVTWGDRSESSELTPYRLPGT